MKRYEIALKEYDPTTEEHKPPLVLEEHDNLHVVVRVDDRKALIRIDDLYKAMKFIMTIYNKQT